METKTKWIIGGVSLVAVVTTVIIIINKKKKKAASTDTSDYNDTNTKTNVNTGIVYTGITQAQTKKLQQKLNEFISSGKLGMVLGWLGSTYTFKEENGKTYWRKGQSNWYAFTKVNNLSKECQKDYYSWLASKAGSSVAKITNGASNLITTPSNTPKTNTGSPNPTSALTTFKNSISANIANETGTGLRVDGKYGNNTLAVVKALQIYLNAVKGSNLVVDGKYGTNTDIATGWGIC